MLPLCRFSCRAAQRLCLAALASLTLPLLSGCTSLGTSTCQSTGACQPGGSCQTADSSCADTDRPAGHSFLSRCGRDRNESDCSLVSAACNVPRELRKTTLPEYVIEPPDILLIEAVNNLRPADAIVHAGEPLLVQVNRTIPFGQTEDPVAVQFKQINGLYVIGTDGYLNLGPEYGKVLVAELPLAEIQQRVDTHLRQILTSPQVLVTLPRPENQQYVAGQHLVRPDGTVGLGIYGSVYVTGMTLQQARLAIENHLRPHIHNPQVSVDILAYNSKVYYVITDGGGAGEQVIRMPSTGNETVLDAVAHIQGLPTVASKGAIWIARPSPAVGAPDQILKVDWNAIAQGAQTQTNYQVLPGDRLYVKASPLITLDTKVAKFTAPFERMLGFTILGNGTVRTIQQGKNADF